MQKNSRAIGKRSERGPSQGRVTVNGIPQGNTLEVEGSRCGLGGLGSYGDIARSRGGLKLVSAKPRTSLRT